MASVFWFSKLKAGAQAAAYERWVQETDYRLAQDIECVLHYRVHRLAGPVEGEGEAPYDYIEVLEVADIDAYRSALRTIPRSGRSSPRSGSSSKVPGACGVIRSRPWERTGEWIEPDGCRPLRTQTQPAMEER